MSRGQSFGIIDVLLIVGIVALTGFLWWTIWSPGQELSRLENLKWESRSRLTALRTAEVQYYNATGRYTADIDSLVQFIAALPVATRDSLFGSLYLTGFSADSLRFAPVSRAPYQIQVSDTTAIPRYMITCPDGYGYISSLTNPDEHNKASWEQ